MISDGELFALIDQIYEAVLDSDLWPSILVKFADAVGVAQVAMPSVDRRINRFATIAPRTDPDFLRSYRDYWVFHDPVLARTGLRPAGEIYTLHSLMPREEFAATPVFKEWWRPAGWGLATAGANLLAENQFTSLICISNMPDKDLLTTEQMNIFEAVLQHTIRAARINRQLWELELKHLAPPEQFEMLPHGALLADATGRVVLANAAAKEMLDSGDGIRPAQRTPRHR